MGQHLSSDIFFHEIIPVFSRSVYYNPTFTKVYSNFSSFTFAEYNTSSVFILPFQTFSSVCDFL